MKFTALDAVREGFRTHVVVDACRGAELHPGDVDDALKQRSDAGVEAVREADVR